MSRREHQLRILAVCLVVLAGYVDALGYLSLGGFFVSFMSGNSTRMGIGISTSHPAAVLAGLVIGAFVVGGVIGSLVARGAGQEEGRAVLTAAAIILAVAAVSAMAGEPRIAAIAMAVAMGTENAVFEHDGHIAVGVTYMTGALVKLGDRIGAALRGTDRWGWVWYLTLWAGLVLGAATGGAVFTRWRLNGLWAAAIVTALLAAIWPRGNSGRILDAS